MAGKVRRNDCQCVSLQLLRCESQSNRGRRKEVGRLVALRLRVEAGSLKGGKSFPSPSVLSAVAEQLDHVREEESANLHQLRAGGGALQQGGHHFEYHWRKASTTHERHYNGEAGRAAASGSGGSLGFWILTEESGSGWGLWTTCVHTCSVRIWHSERGGGKR